LGLDEDEEEFTTEEVEITLTETKEITAIDEEDTETVLVHRNKIGIIII